MKRPVIITNLRHVKAMKEALHRPSEQAAVAEARTLGTLTEVVTRLTLRLDDVERRLNQRTCAEPDHTLVLMIAREWARMSSRAYHLGDVTPASKAIQRGCDALERILKQGGYQVQHFLGQPYDEGLNAKADFDCDLTLPQGTSIITGCRQPQVHYHSQLLQTASIKVSQNV